MIPLALPAAAMAILGATVFWFLPVLTRPDLYFAVTVPPEFRREPRGVAILRRYRLELALVSAIALSVLATCVLSTSGLRFAPAALLLEYAAAFAVFQRARRRVMPHRTRPSTVREVPLQADDGPIVPGGWGVAAVPYLVLAACAAYLRLHWSALPARVVVHWGRGGQPDRWADRSVASVFYPLVSGAATLVLITLVLYWIARRARTVHAAGAEHAREVRFRRVVAAVVVSAGYLVAVQASLAALAPVLGGPGSGPPGGPLPVLLPLLLAAAAIAALARLGQGGSRTAGERQPPGPPPGDRTEDARWFLGVFYVDRNDPAVLVEKRFGLGYTLNFGHPACWLLLLLLLVSLALPLLVARAIH